MTKANQASRKALKAMRAIAQDDAPFIDHGAIVKHPKRIDKPSKRKLSTFPNGSNSPLWFFGFR